MADQLATPEELASYLQRDLDASTANLLLNLATSKVQRAAGGQRVVDATSTAVIDVVADCWDPWLELPQFPVRAVATVTLNGTVITDWYLRQQKLWRADGWRGSTTEPAQAIVEGYQHGYLTGSQYLEFARDCTLSLAGMGYGNPGGVTSEAIDDYKVTWAEANARMQVTEDMRAAIADAYGASAYVTSSR